MAHAVPDLIVCGDTDEWARRAAQQFVDAAKHSVNACGRFSVALAGGSTPRLLYNFLARDPARSVVPWARTFVFWGDERLVPPSHADSNYRMAWETLLTRVAIPPAHVHRIRTELADPETIARDYENEMRPHFGIQPPDVPRFDLILLGMGTDGHTASLFPHSPALHERQRLAVPVHVPHAQVPWRVTLTLPVLNRAGVAMFLVSGEEKRESLRNVLGSTYDPERWPAQAVQPEHGRLLWVVDRAAAQDVQGNADANSRSDPLS
jgi:6-phosphogluconolactonase